MPAEKRTPVCKVSVEGSPLETEDQAMLVKASVDLDAELFAQTTLLFLDPEMKLINGDTFQSGKSIELKMGYDAKAQPVFSGEVVRLEPQFRRDEPVALKVVCQESLHRLALSPMTRAFNDADISTVMSTIAQENGLSADAPSGTKQHILQANVTDAEFLKNYASKLGMQLKLDGTKLTMGSPASTDPIPLSLGDGVKKLKVKKKATSQVADVSVHGYDPKTKQEIVGKAQPQGATGKGAKDFGKGTLSDSSGTLLPPDQATADAMAKGLMAKIAEDFATLEADLIGDPRLTPGQVVELDKLGQGTDGNYRIERANHLFSKHGYYVRFDAVWTGPKTTPAPPKPAPTQYKPPEPPKGKLTRPRWKRRNNGQKDVADLSVDAPGKNLDGKGVTFILESKIAGEWKQVAKADGTVGQGFASATADLDAVAPADVVSEPKWTEAKDNKHEHGQKGKVEITSKVQKPHDLRVILEQQIQGSRIWEELDSQMVKVSGGKATAEFDLEHPHAANAQKKDTDVLKAPTWQEKPRGKEGPGVLSVEAPGMEDGRKVRLIVERFGRDKKWGAIKTVEVEVKGNRAETTLDLKHTNDKAKPADSKVLKQPRWEGGDLEHGKNGTLTVDAAGLDGQRVHFVVERLDGKDWVSVGERTVKVAGGKATTEMPMKHPIAKGAPGQKLGAAAHDPKTGVASIGATSMDGRVVTFVAEKNTANGWQPAGSAVAIVKDGKASAKVTAPKAEGKLEKPVWSKPSAAHGTEVEVSVQAKGQDGGTVEFTLERLDGSQWVTAGTARGVVRGGKASARITVSHPAAGKKLPGADALKAAKLRFRAKVVADELRVNAELAPETEPAKLPAVHDPKTGAASMEAKGLDGRKVIFVAEKKTAQGWKKVGSALATVKGGSASAKVTAPKKEGKLEKPSWSKPSAVHGNELLVSVQAKDHDGETVEFTLERLEGKDWVTAGTARGPVRGGKASAKITVSHPAAGKKSATVADLKASKLRFRASLVGGEEVRVHAELQPDITPARLRFRAEQVADVGAQKLRFRAEPVPDLKPRKLRFRTEVPIPENPALTRLRVELKGGTPDDHVSTPGSGS